MSSPPSEAEGHRRAVMAAVLAVQRGLLSPEDAIDLVGGVLENKPGEPVAADPVATIQLKNPAAQAHALTRELEDMMARGGSALEGLGLTAEQQVALESLRPGRAEAREQARKALIDLARARVAEIRRRLPVSGGARYTVQREFARGGMGRIMLATDTAVGREVALKEVLVPGEGTGTDPTDANPEIVERFLREAKITGQLEHPNIVPVYEISRRDDGSIFYTMKLVRGRSMAERLAEIAESQTSDPAKLAQRLKLLEAFLNVCHAISYAHSRGVIHRDLKPQNIMLGNFGETVVLDWGLARMKGEDDVKTVQPQSPRFSPTLNRQARESHTLDGSVIGTPSYMPPEQARGQLELVDAKSDVYALGAILYEILAGRPPYVGLSSETIVAKVLESTPPLLLQESPLAPPDLVALSEKAMARDRDKRIASAEILAREIAAYRDGRPLSVYEYSSGELMRRFVGRNRGAVAVAALAVIVLAGVIAYAMASVIGSEHDAREALAKAKEADDLREQAEGRQEQELARLVQQRRGEIARQQSAIEALRPLAARKAVDNTIGELRAMTPESRLIQGTNRQSVGAAVAALLAVANERAEVIRLCMQPVAGRQVELMPAAELEHQEGAMFSERLAAAELAALNADFGLALIILDGTRGREDELESARALSRQLREALDESRRHRLSVVLGEIRTGRDGRGSPVNASRVREYVQEVGAWRTPHTVEILGPVVHERVAAAKDAGPGIVWDVRQRLEIQFLGGVLVQVGFPELSAPLLGDLLHAVTERELVIELGTALCHLDHTMAWDPVVRLADVYGFESLIWLRVARHFWRVPEPQTLPVPATAEECRRLVRLFRSRRRPPDQLLGGSSHFSTQAYRDQPAFAKARFWIDEGLKLDSEDAELLLLLSRLNWEARLEHDQILNPLERVLALHPRHARALAWKAYFAQVVERDISPAKLLAMADAAVEADSRDWHVRMARAELRSYFTREQPELAEGILEDIAVALEARPDNPELYELRMYALFNTDQKGEALADLSRAMELDPENPEYVTLRARAYFSMEELDAALRDVNRAIELGPMRHDAYVWRHHIRMRKKDFRGALQDADTVMQLSNSTYTPVYQLRAEALRQLGRVEHLREAVKSLEKYLQERPNFRDSDDVRKEVAELKQKIDELEKGAEKADQPQG